MKAMRQIQAEAFSFASSIKEDVWHPKTNPKAYEWWYFDALSDNGKDAVVIIFLDNFIFSPRYNKSANRNQETVVGGQGPEDSKSEIAIDETNPEFKIQNPKSGFPAVVFVYYRDGQPCYRAINEFSPE